MAAGPKRRWIVIVNPATTQDDFGQEGATGDPTVVLATWASIRAATSREIYAAGPGFEGQITHVVCIRWNPAPITNGMLIQYQDRTFLVQAPAADPDESRRDLNILCLEQTK